MINCSYAARALHHSSRSTTFFSCFFSSRFNYFHFIRRDGFGTTNNKRAITELSKGQAEYFFNNILLKKARLRLNARGQFISSRPLVSSQKGASSQNLSAELPHQHQHEQRTTETVATSCSIPIINSNIKSFILPYSSYRQLFSVLLALSKPRLTMLVVLTACASYSLYPVPDLLTPSSTSTPSLSPLTLIFLTSGTTLCAASANTFNMLYEPKGDALMSRTRNRPLVRGLITMRGAAIFAISAGLVGTTALYFGVNPTVSFLGLLNIALYAGVYTPMKKVSVVNTWIGAIVGGLPPLMGWAAAAGQSAIGGDWRELLLGEWNIGGWLLAALVLAWQFPHFMSLSWSIREEYKNAGYKMLCWINPARNSRVALRYSLLIFPICAGLCYFGVTEWSFVVASAPINAWLVREAVSFWRYQGARGSARNLFWASVWHLPVVMILAMVEKKGMWQRIYKAINVNNEDDEDWEEGESYKSDESTVGVNPVTQI